MATIDKVQFVAEQLRNISPNAEWNAAGIDRAQELARIMVRAGVTDLWALKLIPVSWEEHTPSRYVETEGGMVIEPGKTEVIKSYAFDYYGRRIGFLGTPDVSENRQSFELNDNGYAIAWSAEGHGNITYLVQPDTAARMLRIIPKWGSSSDAGEIRGALITAISFFAMTVLPMAGVSLGAVIGNAVLPASFAAAYPAVATAVGNVALSAALNGGDVKEAIKGVAVSSIAGGAGMQAGNFVQAASGSDLFGSVVNAATRVAISGGDVKQAVALELLSKGVTNMSADDNFILQSFNAGNDLPALDFPTDFTWNFDNVNFTGGDWWNSDPAQGGFDFGAVFGNDVLPPVWFDEIPAMPDLQLPPAPVEIDAINWNPFAAPTAAPGSPITPPPTVQQPQNPNSGSYSPSQIVQGISAAAMSALQLIKAYRQLDTPAVQTTARNVASNGAVSVIGNNGLIQTRNANGSITSSVPPVGVPQATTSGNYIVNNGDGTYTVVSPTGQTQTVRYSAGVNTATGSATGSIIPGVPNVLLLVGAGLLLMKRN